MKAARGRKRCGQVLPRLLRSRLIAVTGMRARKRDPRPSRLSALTTPLIRSQSRLVMARPNPVPPKRREVELSLWTNGRNSAERVEGAMPGPVSATTSSRRLPPSLVRSVISAVTVPVSVNLIAFEIRLTRICRMRKASLTAKGTWP